VIVVCIISIRYILLLFWVAPARNGLTFLRFFFFLFHFVVRHEQIYVDIELTENPNDEGGLGFSVAGGKDHPIDGACFLRFSFVWHFFFGISF
jgi:hypothetical protein